MFHFMVRWKFAQGSTAGMVSHPHGREAQSRALVESFGGKLHSYYFTLGEFDGLAIGVLPDLTSSVAMGMAATSTGAFLAWETTALMTSEEATVAMRQAHDTNTAYRPPNAQIDS